MLNVLKSHFWFNSEVLVIHWILQKAFPNLQRRSSHFPIFFQCMKSICPSHQQLFRVSCQCQKPLGGNVVSSAAVMISCLSVFSDGKYLQYCFLFQQTALRAVPKIKRLITSSKKFLGRAWCSYLGKAISGTTTKEWLGAHLLYSCWQRTWHQHIPSCSEYFWELLGYWSTSRLKQ